MKNLLLCVVVLVLAVGCEPDKGCCSKPDRSALAFTASYCGPCQRDKPVIRTLQAAGARIMIVDIQSQPGLAEKYGITSIPHYVILDGRRIVGRTGNLSEARRLLGR